MKVLRLAGLGSAGMIMLLPSLAFGHAHYNSGSCTYNSSINANYRVSAGTKEGLVLGTFNALGKIVTFDSVQEGQGVCSTPTTSTALHINLTYQHYRNGAWFDCTSGGLFNNANSSTLAVEGGVGFESVPIAINDVCTEDGNRLVQANEYVRVRAECTITRNGNTINCNSFTEIGSPITQYHNF